ncbi:MarR family transcriptional regulator [Streptomyces sp. NPDC046909]|uniref:MarR family winged helix-turn-helix transcriptional regulator n=1 Tax=Streptomyces sp. NPDC046909 TaxID=3155617 RepID=UPI00340E00FC
MHLLRRALQNCAARWQETVGDITPPQYAVLRSVQNSPGIDQSRLGEATGIDPATLAALVHRMEQRGLLAREVDPENRRRKLLTLTAEGGATATRIRPLADAVDEYVVRDLTEPQREALLEALWRLGGGRDGREP